VQRGVAYPPGLLMLAGSLVLLITAALLIAVRRLAERETRRRAALPVEEQIKLADEEAADRQTFSF
jgi:hypothetical protein